MNWSAHPPQALSPLSAFSISFGCLSRCLSLLFLVLLVYLFGFLSFSSFPFLLLLALTLFQHFFCLLFLLNLSFVSFLLHILFILSRSWFRCSPPFPLSYILPHSPTSHFLLSTTPPSPKPQKTIENTTDSLLSSVANVKHSDPLSFQWASSTSVTSMVTATFPR